MCDQDAGHMGDHRDGSEIIDGVIGQFAKQWQTRSQHTTIREKQRVTIGCRLCGRSSSNPSARAAAIVDDDRLAPSLGESLFQDTTQSVGSPTRRRRDQQTNRLTWILLCKRYRRRRRHRDGRDRKGNQVCRSHACFLSYGQLMAAPTLFTQSRERVRSLLSSASLATCTQKGVASPSALRRLGILVDRLASLYPVFTRCYDSPPISFRSSRCPSPVSGSLRRPWTSTPTRKTCLTRFTTPNTFLTSPKS